MIGTFKFILRIAGIVILLLIFGSVYMLVTDFNNKSDIFDTKNKTIGELGGFHLLTDVMYENTDDYWRIALNTTMNRTSSLNDSINTPYIEVQLKEVSTPVLFGDGEKTIPELGSHYLLVNLSDTRVFDLSESQAKFVFVGDDRQLINQDNINEVRLHQPPDDSLYQILIGVDEAVDFRLLKNEEDTGIVWIDILK